METLWSVFPTTTSDPSSAATLLAASCMNTAPTPASLPSSTSWASVCQRRRSRLSRSQHGTAEGRGPTLRFLFG
ncbi:hypothetical protein TEQG_02409 [Trichophyton equinum CBS 127.97]|uniref:Uncharacterized protein n=1 Tax=Trichophyton equinum (strain ATCC MYA-4606 / CBS 127.97) TaxID=559882 RepID=F2PNA5_TRIEC|nr:hypothetical protein TEQG_02409 [Trichophyton equinum CBS 127.97]